jgi:hypothetical protein
MFRTLSALLLLAAWSCSPKPAENEKAIENSEDLCYVFISGKDSIRMNIQVVNDIFEGSMSYKMFEKDGSRGDIKGLIQGDTLIGEYHFHSEGMESWREMMFLKNGESLVEGIGPQDEQGSKMRFADRTQVTFTGMVLQPIDCGDEQPAQ